MSFVDTKFIGLVSVRLQKFSKKKEGLYAFRCPYCGDSQKNKNKTRGYITDQRMITTLNATIVVYQGVSRTS